MSRARMRRDGIAWPRGEALPVDPIANRAASDAWWGGVLGAREFLTQHHGAIVAHLRERPALPPLVTVTLYGRPVGTFGVDAWVDALLKFCNDSRRRRGEPLIGEDPR